MSKVKIIGAETMLVYGHNFDAVGRKASSYLRKGYEIFSDEYALWKHKKTNNELHLRTVTLTLKEP